MRGSTVATMKLPHVKTVLYNGKPVGTYIATGNREQELEASRAVLLEAGIDLNAGKAAQLTALGQARSFGVVTKLIVDAGFKSHPWNPDLVAPLVVNASFCIEVFLKALGKLVGKDLRGHQLNALFDALPMEQQDAIQKEFDNRLPIHRLPPSALRDELASMSKAFEQWRYLYEKDTRLEFEVRVALAVIEALDRVCIGMTGGTQHGVSDLAK